MIQGLQWSFNHYLWLAKVEGLGDNLCREQKLCNFSIVFDDISTVLIEKAGSKSNSSICKQLCQHDQSDVGGLATIVVRKQQFVSLALAYAI